MKVKDLIRLLCGFPQDLRVVIDGYEGGLEDISKDRVTVKGIQLDYHNDEYCGEHELPEYADNRTDEEALYIKRRMS